jgi:hypothetical protein
MNWTKLLRSKASSPKVKLVLAVAAVALVVFVAGGLLILRSLSTNPNNVTPGSQAGSNGQNPESYPESFPNGEVPTEPSEEPDDSEQPAAPTWPQALKFADLARNDYKNYDHLVYNKAVHSFSKDKKLAKLVGNSGEVVTFVESKDGGVVFYSVRLAKRGGGFTFDLFAINYSKKQYLKIASKLPESALSVSPNGQVLTYFDKGIKSYSFATGKYETLYPGSGLTTGNIRWHSDSLVTLSVAKTTVDYVSTVHKFAGGKLQPITALNQKLSSSTVSMGVLGDYFYTFKVSDNNYPSKKSLQRFNLKTSQWANMLEDRSFYAVGLTNDGQLATVEEKKIVLFKQAANGALTVSSETPTQERVYEFAGSASSAFVNLNTIVESVDSQPIFLYRLGTDKKLKVGDYSTGQSIDTSISKTLTKSGVAYYAYTGIIESAPMFVDLNSLSKISVD